MTFSGIMAPTGTPYDKAIYIPLLTFYELGGHEIDTTAMAGDENVRTVSGAFIRFRRVLGGKAIHFDMLKLADELKRKGDAQLVIPNKVLPRLFAIIGGVDKVLFGISVLVIIMAVLFLFVSLYWALRERRRNIALMRALGATRGTVFMLILFEAVTISAIGTIFGIAAGHGLLSVGVELIRTETGVRLSAMYISLADILAIPGAILIGLITGMIPAIQAYRLGVLRNLASTL
jgi:putative ABC transport system permease protein